MSNRALWYTLSRPGVLIPGIVGVFLLAGRGWFLAGAILLAVAVAKAVKLLGYADTDLQLRLRDDKRKYGVGRLLTSAERAEVVAIDAYCKDLVQAGCDEVLAREVRERSWEIVRRSTHNDAACELLRFRQSLPAVPKAVSDPPLEERLARELEIVRAARQELDSVRPQVS